MMRHGIAASSVSLLEKPFAPAVFAQCVREMLEAEPPVASDPPHVTG